MSLFVKNKWVFTIFMMAILVTVGYISVFSWNSLRHDVQCDGKFDYKDALHENEFYFSVQMTIFMKKNGRAVAYLFGVLGHDGDKHAVSRHVYFDYNGKHSNQYYFNVTETKKMMRDTVEDQQAEKMYKVLGLHRDMPILIDEKEQYLMFGSRVLPFMLCVKQ